MAFVTGSALGRIFGRLSLGCALLACLMTAALPAERSLDPAAQVRAMGRGMNVLGYDPLWSDPAKARFKTEDFRVIREGGFLTIRVNLQAFAHMDAAGNLDPNWLKTLDWVVKEGTAAGLQVILDEHDFKPCAADAASCGQKLGAFWQQVGTRYADAPPNVIFELLNEPHGQLTADVWNHMLADLLGVVRATNPQRNVIVGPIQSNSFRALGSLVLPEGDRHLIVTIHYYDPFRFTHQGAPWSLTTVSHTGIAWGSPEERAQVGRDFDTVAAWARAHDRPIFLGEFGAYDRADMSSRAAYLGAVARAAEERGFAWAYWQFDSDFVAYDIKAASWIEPIHDALVPGAAR